ncbi:MAG: c-type cytochrome [Bacteroidota bacterium]
MKKFLLPALLVSLLIACGGGEEKKAEEAKTEETPVQDLSANPDYQKGLELVGQSDCLTCHKVNEASTGPAYALVAEKYAGAADTTITRIAGKIISGGAGVWGTVPMTAHPQLSQADAEQMVKYILLLKK